MNIRIYFYPRMKIDRCSPRTNCSSVLSASFLMTFYQIQMKKLLISHHLTSKELATLRRCVWPARCCTLCDIGAHPDHFRQKMFSFTPTLLSQEALCEKINQSNMGNFIVPVVRWVYWYIITTKWLWLCSWQPKIWRKRLKNEKKWPRNDNFCATEAISWQYHHCMQYHHWYLVERDQQCNFNQFRMSGSVLRPSPISPR